MSFRRVRRAALSFETLEVRHLLSATPFISELLASNSGGLQDQDGDFSDWLEITNPALTPVDLGGWYLTDNGSNLTKWQFPSVSIPAGGSLVVFASSKDRTDPASELHANFSLSAGGEYLGLVAPDGVTVASAYDPQFPAQSANVSYGYTPVGVELLPASGAGVLIPTNGSLGTAWTAPGFDASAWTPVASAVGYHTGGDYAPLIGTDIRTAMQGVGSSAYLRVPFTVSDLAEVEGLLLKMQFDDGFVAYLNGTEVARGNAPASAVWNSVATASTPAGAPSTATVDLTGQRSLLVEGNNVLAIHGLNRTVGSTDFLIHPELIALDLNPEPAGFLQTPTPGVLNLASLVNQVANPQFSHERGFYDAAFNLVLASDTVGATIRYTTNGSAPSTTVGQVYTGAIPISTTGVVRAIAYKTGMQPTTVQTHSFLFLEDVIQQPANIAGHPNTVVSVGAGKFAPTDYEMDPAVVNNPAYHDALLSGLQAIPTMALTVNLADMYGSGGFYSGESEEPVSVEIFDPANPGLNQQVDGGIEPHSHNRLKRSLRLSFKPEYGPTKLVSDLFRQSPLNGDTAANVLDNLVLRAGNNRAWSRAWNPSMTTYTEDQWYRDTQIAMQGYGSHGAFVHLYINGIYWGLYNPVERPDEGFSSEYFGGADEEWFSINHDGRTSGDATRWNYLQGALLQKDMSVAVNYEELKQYIDVENFTDYLLLNWYQATTDWPNNNWYASNRNDQPTPTKFFAWDGEWSWDTSNGGSVDGAWVHPAFRVGSNTSTPATKIWRALVQSDEFMQQFADRAHQHLANDGLLTDASSLERWNTLNDYVRDAVVAESARWGDALETLGQPTRTRDVDWQNEVNQIAGLMVGNAAQLIAAMRDQGYYPDLDAPGFNQHGGSVTAGFVLQISIPSGADHVYYTTDGSDPRLPGGAVSPSAVLYNPASGPVLLASGEVRARAIDGGQWSAINEAAFDVAELPFGPGDYNRDRIVDSADYDVWRSTFGSTTQLDADGNGDLVVDAADYSVWRDALGQTTTPLAVAASGGASTPQAAYAEPIAAAVGSPVVAGSVVADPVASDPAAGLVLAPLAAPSAGRAAQLSSPSSEVSADDALLLLLAVDRAAHYSEADAPAAAAAAPEQDGPGPDVDPGLAVGLDPRFSLALDEQS
ncbi:CotH protein [Pirellulimonas nuda]|uniref:CotH protein n=1 Tax=Pirellulimonas nuda TaxID=2528009 RepID=A0A518DJW6_9BACT|nr:chitobiase/beta-hexosaminidase C-terminal domain-containing protein [Pirellulimonas nuda]QDU91767.1 CotH protein [Pirellulimonas nuda]